jgi:hypothetical protein
MKWTTAIITALVIPTVALAQDPTSGRDTSQAQGRDTARAQSQERDRSRGESQMRTESRGNVDMARGGARGRTTWGLSNSQIRELQQSLQSIDCYDAEIDGIIGPRTRAGIGCAMRHHDISGDDPNELTQALGLNFQVEGNRGLGTVMRSGAARNNRQGDPSMNRQRDPSQSRQRDTAGQRSADTLQGNRSTPNPTPQNAPPR